MTGLAGAGDQIEGQVLSTIEGMPVIGHITVKTLLAGDEMLMLKLTCAAGAASQPHRHDHESHCYLVSGRMTATLADQTWEVSPGDACIHPAGVLHAMVAVEESVVVEIKSPRPDPERFLS